MEGLSPPHLFDLAGRGWARGSAQACAGGSGMALSWVKVVRSDGTGEGVDVFVNGNFVDAAGTIGAAFRTETGQCTFETLDATPAPDWRKVATIDRPPGNSKNKPILVTLELIAPVPPAPGT